MLRTIKENWTEIIERMKEEFEISDAAYKTWVLRLEPFSFEDNTLYVTYSEVTISPSYLNKKYQLPLKVTISDFIGQDIEVIIESDKSVSDRLNKADILSQEDIAALYSSSLNLKYTFSNFVVGSSNELAYATALAVAEDPGEYANPLFIYGGSGLGKTHLMNSIAHQMLERDPKCRILYVTSEDFTNELISSINKRSQEEFKSKYRNADILLIDDIQFIVGKESTQEEFFHTFNALYEKKKQIVISSDKAPRDIEGLPERLVSRFMGATSVDVQPPNYETRVAILRNKLDLDHMDMDLNSLHYIAENITTNIRELEGALNQVKNYARFHNINKIDLSTTEAALINVIRPNEKKALTLERILSVVAEHYGADTTVLKGKRRNAEIVQPRQIYMYLAKKYTDNSLQAIGGYIGGKDHTTVSYGADRIEEDMKKDINLKANIEMIVKKLNIN
ncbi:MAG: chromosomal replication initiator protein DnaA [Lachnospiraceae bacterium]|nr:chromosomal replication initiator protein DnaA [Lachnospiraceae bacterium]